MQNQNQYSQHNVFQFLKKRLTLNILSCQVFQKLATDIPKSLIAKAFQILIKQSQQTFQTKNYLKILRKLQKNFKKKILHLKRSCQDRLQQIIQVQKQQKNISTKYQAYPCSRCRKKTFKNKISLGVHFNKCKKRRLKLKYRNRNLALQQNILQKKTMIQQKVQQSSKESKKSQETIKPQNNEFQLDLGGTQSSNFVILSIQENQSFCSLLQSPQPI